MVDFHNPAVIEKDLSADVKLWHVLAGIFIWEFFTTLDFEWSVIRGYRPYRWTIWIYSITRVCTLIFLILIMFALDSSVPVHCRLWVIFESIFGSLTFWIASSLIVLRIIAIWDRNLIAMAIAVLAWSTNVASHIYYISGLLAEWAPGLSVCEWLNTERGNKAIITTLVTDVVLLLTMLVGLLRLRQSGTMFALGQLLWNQGLVWLFAASVAELPPAVFIELNLNAPLNLMFQSSGLVVMSIAATRIHRSLTDFTGRSTFDTHPTRRGHSANADTKLIFEMRPPLEVAVDTSTSDCPPPPNLDRYPSSAV